MSEAHVEEQVVIGKRNVIGNLELKFSVNQEVLARWGDGLLYLGVIIKVDEKNKRCCIRFEDNSEYWSLFKDIFKGVSTDDIQCSLCLGESSEKPNEIVLCDLCGQGYHQQCHNPVIDSEVLKPDISWACRACVFASTTKKGGASKTGPNAQAFQTMKQSLPYNLHSLTWDAHHKVNTEQCYCYCGGPGDWYLKMLQCCRCKQWFHEACIQCLEKPLLYGDRFYLFVCSFCNHGPEYMKRLELKWVDITQIALFNLTVQFNKKYYDYEETLMPWIFQNWDNLQLPEKLENVTKAEMRSNVMEALHGHKCKFQCGKEIKKKTTLWGLRVRLPPLPPTVILPQEGQISDEVMNNLQMKGRKTKTFVPVESSPVPLKYHHKRRASSEPDNAPKPKKKKLFREDSVVKENEFQVNRRKDVTKDMSNVNPSYMGYTGHQDCYSLKNPDDDPDETCSQGTLDSIIPVPHDFEGLNHPFKTVLERNQEIAHSLMKERLLNSYTNGSLNGDTETDSDVMSGITNTSSTKSGVTSESSVSTSQPVVKVPKKRGRKKKSELLAAAASASTSNTSSSPRKHRECYRINEDLPTTNGTSSVVKKDTLDKVRSAEVSLVQLKSSMCDYFGAADRLANGEKFQVLARRVTPEGKVQYLVEWQGITA